MTQTKLQNWLHYGGWPLLLIVGIIVLRSFVLITLRIEHSAMAPSLSAGQYILAVRHLEPQRGDIVLIDASELYTAAGTAPHHLVRVVALPGDSLSFREGRLWVADRVIHHYPREVADTLPYTLRLPLAHESTPLNPTNLVAYRAAIESQLRRITPTPKFHWEHGQLYVASTKVEYFGFENDYYWVLVDDPRQGPDSRHLGIVPRSAIEAVVLLHH